MICLVYLNMRIKLADISMLNGSPGIFRYVIHLYYLLRPFIYYTVHLDRNLSWSREEWWLAVSMRSVCCLLCVTQWCGSCIILGDFVVLPSVSCPASVSSRTPTRIHNYVVGSTRTHWRWNRRCLLPKWTSRLYIYSLFPCLLVPNVYTLIISQLPHVL